MLREISAEREVQRPSQRYAEFFLGPDVCDKTRKNERGEHEQVVSHVLPASRVHSYVQRKISWEN